MQGSTMLMKISDYAAKAARVYPQVVEILNDAGVPPDDRVQVMAYIAQVICLDDVPRKRRTLN